MNELAYRVALIAVGFSESAQARLLPVPYMPEFLDCTNGKVWPNDRPGLGVSVDEKQLTFLEAMTEAAPGPTHRRPDGSLTHW